MRNPRYDEYRGFFLTHGLIHGLIRWGGSIHGLSRGIQAPTNARYASASIKPSSSDGLESSIFMSQPFP